MERFLRKDISGRVDMKSIIPPNKEEIIELSSEYFKNIRDITNNIVKIKTSFKNENAGDLAQIEFFHDILAKTKNAAIISINEGIREYVDWYSRRYHVPVIKKIFFFGKKFITDNIIMTCDLAELDFASSLIRERSPYDLIICDDDKLFPATLKYGGDMIIKCNIYNLEKTSDIISQFNEYHIINSAVNTKNIYIVCKNKLKEAKKVDIRYDYNYAFLYSYITSKTNTLMMDKLAFSYDIEKINQLWQLPKAFNVNLSNDPQYLPYNKIIKDENQGEYKQGEIHPLVDIENLTIPEMIFTNDMFLLGNKKISYDNSLKILLKDEAYFMRSFTKEECVKFFLRDDIAKQRIYKLI